MLAPLKIYFSDFSFQQEFVKRVEQINGPLVFDYENDSIEEIVEKIEFAIEQHPSLLKVIPIEEIEELSKLDQQRKWKY